MSTLAPSCNCPPWHCPGTISVDVSYAQVTLCLPGCSLELRQHQTNPGEAIFSKGTQVLYLLEEADAKKQTCTKATFVLLTQNKTSVIHNCYSKLCSCSLTVLAEQVGKAFCFFFSDRKSKSFSHVQLCCSTWNTLVRMESFLEACSCPQLQPRCRHHELLVLIVASYVIHVARQL